LRLLSNRAAGDRRNYSRSKYALRALPDSLAVTRRSALATNSLNTAVTYT
jgi:hypothetical protein